jgi:hypothetical protein
VMLDLREPHGLHVLEGLGVHEAEADDHQVFSGVR